MGWDPTFMLLQHIISVLLKLLGQQVWGKLSRTPSAMGHNRRLVSLLAQFSLGCPSGRIALVFLSNILQQMHCHI